MRACQPSSCLCSESWPPDYSPRWLRFGSNWSQVAGAAGCWVLYGVCWRVACLHLASLSRASPAWRVPSRRPIPGPRCLKPGSGFSLGKPVHPLAMPLSSLRRGSHLGEPMRRPAGQPGSQGGTCGCPGARAVQPAHAAAAGRAEAAGEGHRVGGGVTFKLCAHEAVCFPVGSKWEGTGRVMPWRKSS